MYERKTILLFSLLTIYSATFLLAKIVHASSTSTVHVVNNVQGATVNTHIETNVNGNDQVYDSHSSGSVTVHNAGSSYSVETTQGTGENPTTPTPNLTPSVTKPISITSTPAVSPTPMFHKKMVVVFSFHNFFHTLLQKLTYFFRLH